MMKFHFPRPALVNSMVTSITGGALFNDASNGLFLAAPRRTGKTTFLKNELKPALEAKGVIVVYVDLWEDKKRDPAVVIAEGIEQALHENLGAVARAARASGLDSITVAGIKIDTSKIGKIDGATLRRALEALNKATSKPVALIIDEAQHALTSADGDAAMSALKSARDQMNTPDDTNLMLIMSGSDRDKLLRLVNSNTAAFFGSSIQRMPELDIAFVTKVAQVIEHHYPALAPVKVDALWSAFELLRKRPQPLIEMIGAVLNPLNNPQNGFEDDILARANALREADEKQMESDYLSLKAVEKAVLWRILDKQDSFRPYDSEALRFYSVAAGRKVSAQQAQTAIEYLRDREPTIVWKSAKGEYVLDDTAMYVWFNARVQAGTWPPKGPAEDDISDDADAADSDV